MMVYVLQLVEHCKSNTTHAWPLHLSIILSFHYTDMHWHMWAHTNTNPLAYTLKVIMVATRISVECWECEGSSIFFFRLIVCIATLGSPASESWRMWMADCSSCLDCPFRDSWRIFTSDCKSFFSCKVESIAMWRWTFLSCSCAGMTHLFFLASQPMLSYFNAGDDRVGTCGFSVSGHCMVSLQLKFGQGTSSCHMSIWSCSVSTVPTHTHCLSILLHITGRAWIVRLPMIIDIECMLNVLVALA